MTTTSIAAAAHPPESPWRLALPPGIWLTHFVATYVTAAGVCGRWGAPETAGGALLILGYSATALVGLTICLVAGAAPPILEPANALDDDTPAGRRQFVATTNALLVLVSAIAVIFVAAATWMVPACR